MKEAVELLSIIASAIFGKQFETSKTRDESPDAWFDFYFNLMENTWNKYQMLIKTISFLMVLIITWKKLRRHKKKVDDKFDKLDTRLEQLIETLSNKPQNFVCSYVNTNKLDNRRTSINPKLETETRSSLESQDSTLLYQTSRIEPPTKFSTPLHTETNGEWFTKRDKTQKPSRHVRFSPDSFDTQESRQLEMYNPHPILFVSPPEKFDPKKTDVRQWVKDFDMFIESKNIGSRKINIVLAHLDHETRRIIENNQFSLHEETAYKELKTLLIQWYGKKATSNLELKQQFTERVQNQYENVHLYASQLKVLTKQSHPEFLQYQKDDLIKEQFIRGLRD
ncbi:unnamed protein product, partial [Brachionus calyciflorus]